MMAPDASFGRSTAGSPWDSPDRSSRLVDLLDQFELDTHPFPLFSLDILSKLPYASDFSVYRDEQVTDNTRVKWKETREAQFFTADSLWVKKEEVKIELVGDGSSRIRGERHEKDAQKTAHCYKVERSRGECVAQFRQEKEEVKIGLVDGGLIISGERHKRDFQQVNQWHRLNRSNEYRVPKNVNTGGISAKLEDGALTVKDSKIKAGAASGLKKKLASGAENRSNEYRVPKNVNTGGISAKLEDGALTVKDSNIKAGAASGLKKKMASGASGQAGYSATG